MVDLTTQWQVIAPARLHLGFIDLHGGIGSKFGSVGITLSQPKLVVEATHSEQLQLSGEHSDRIASYVKCFDEAYQVTSRCTIRLTQSIPPHIGLGSGTQMALAIGQILAKLHGLELSSSEIAMRLGRGARSGIGLHAFNQGGVLVDAGVKDQHPPVLVFRQPFPDPWRILLITVQGHDGLHGEAERTAFEQLPPFTTRCAGALSRTLLLQLMPAVIEQDFSSFSTAVYKLQTTMSDYFATVQGGDVSEQGAQKILEYLREQGIKGTGQTSWGPTIFAIVESHARAQSLQTQLAQWIKSKVEAGDASLADGQTREVFIVQGDNQGAVIKAE